MTRIVPVQRFIVPGTSLRRSEHVMAAAALVNARECERAFELQSEFACKRERERRRRARALTSWQATIWLDGDSVRATVLDASTTGVFAGGGPGAAWPLDARSLCGRTVMLHILTNEQGGGIEIVSTICWAGLSLQHQCEGAGLQFVSGQLSYLDF